MLRSALVNALPDGLWWPPNTYPVFGRTVHLCTDAAGHGTVEWERKTIARGSPIVGPSSRGGARRNWLGDIDLGWVALISAFTVAAVAVIGMAVATLRRRRGAAGASERVRRNIAGRSPAR